MASFSNPESLIPSYDKQRLSKLQQYQILDTPPEEAFDKIARLAAQIFSTPSAFVTFVDKDRVFFKANQSALPDNQIHRNHSLCSLAILENGLTVFNDTHQIPDLQQSPYVSCEGGIRFYAGAPLKTSQGFRLGTLCVVDALPRQVTAYQLEMLETLASIVVDQLEGRLAARKAIRAQTDLIHMAVHELKNPALNISALANLLLKKSFDKEQLKEVAGHLKTCGEDITNRLDNLLKLQQMEEVSFTLTLEETDLCALIEEVVHNFNLLAGQKRQHLQTVYQSPIKGMVDKTRIQEVVENLVGNAIKYSYPDTEITICLEKHAQEVLISIQDQGQGFTEKDLEKIFTKFAKLSAIPTGKETSTGLGLSIVKGLVELHKGKVWVESEGAGKGSIFFISLPQ